jgi:hypothetical protein
MPSPFHGKRFNARLSVLLQPLDPAAAEDFVAIIDDSSLSGREGELRLGK